MANPDQKQYITDDGKGRYFHIILNMADDDLNPYEYRLLGHYIRVAAKKGLCWESVRTSAKITKMSVGMVVKTRNKLLELGYIIVKNRDDDTCVVRIVDRMAENIARYAPTEPQTDTENMDAPSGKPRNKRSPGEQYPIAVHGVNTSVLEGVHGVNQRRERTITTTTRSSAPSIEDNDIDQPSLANASDVDPVILDNRYPNRPRPSMADNALLKKLRGEGRGSSNSPSDREDSAEESANEDLNAHSSLAEVKPRKSTPRRPPESLPAHIAQAVLRQSESSSSAPSSQREIFQTLADLVGKTLSDTEKKNLCARRELTWRGTDRVAKPAADLFDRDPHFQEYVKWMVEQAKRMDSAKLTMKLIVSMIRNYNRADPADPEQAGKKIAGWWLWEEEHPRPATQAQAAAADPASVDWNGPWVYDRSAKPPFPEVYYCKWKAVRENNEVVERWVHVADVADWPEDTRKEYLANLNR